MSTAKRILATLTITAIAAAALAAWTGTAHAANPAGYTDGTETYQFAAPFDTPTGFGPPPEAPHLETLNGEAVVCVDPPNSQLGYVNLTIHTDQNADVLIYAHDEAHHTQQFHTIESGLIDACEPWTPPAAVCPEDGTDQVVTVWATWNIGSGRSALLELPTDCTPEYPTPALSLTTTQSCEAGTDVTLTNTGTVYFNVADGPFGSDTVVIPPGGTTAVNVGSDAGSLTVTAAAYPKTASTSVEWAATAPCPPVELAPPVVTVATPAATPVTELAVTGAADDAALAAWALGIIGVGYLMGRQAKAKRGLQ